jgi:hypothetical protein
MGIDTGLGTACAAGSSPDLWRCAAVSATEGLERETGIEPASLAWKAKVLPLNYSRFEPLAVPLGKEVRASQNRSQKDSSLVVEEVGFEPT